MNIESVPFGIADWSQITPTIHHGRSGYAEWRTLEVGNLRIRVVEYSPGYVADHWCERGHVLLVLQGELHTELADGSRHHLTTGMSYHVANGVDPHRSRTETGAKLFIVD